MPMELAVQTHLGKPVELAVQAQLAAEVQPQEAAVQPGLVAE